MMQQSGESDPVLSSIQGVIDTLSTHGPKFDAPTLPMQANERIGMSAAGSLEEITIVDEVRWGGFVAQRISDDMEWGVGAIKPQEAYAGRDVHHELVGAVLRNTVEVPEEELDLSTCTDGRLPLQLRNGEPVPVRKKLVGGNVVLGFAAAEALREEGLFYKDPTAPVDERIEEMAEWLYENDKMPSGHEPCGAGTEFETIIGVTPTFAKNPLYVARTRFFIPRVYDPTVQAELVHGYQQRAARGDYAPLRPAMFVSAIERLTGPRGLADLHNDGRGVHGHVEELIARQRVGNYALDEGSLGMQTDGREAFATNDDEMDEIAQVIARRVDPNDRRVYQIARTAVENFTNSGHGGLSQGLPTWVVGRA
jgi:hypothetical protein